MSDGDPERKPFSTPSDGDRDDFSKRNDVGDNPETDGRPPRSREDKDDD
jgi:hypothetical protein